MARISQRLYRLIAVRARYCCEYCQLPQDAEAMDLTIDHVVPQSDEGETDESNLALACLWCNSHKWTQTKATDPKTGRAASLFHPRQQTWSDHFRWSVDDPTRLEGSTAIGRATIAALQMSSRRAMQIRRWLMLINRHPPTF